MPKRLLYRMVLIKKDDIIMVAKDYDRVNSDLLLGKMVKSLTASDVLQLLEDDEFGLSKENDSNFEAKV